MTIYVDNARIARFDRVWCHMVADTLGELHRFAKDIGVKRCWFHRGRTHPHYDLTEKQRATAIGAGAVAITQRELLVRSCDLVGRPLSSRSGVQSDPCMI